MSSLSVLADRYFRKLAEMHGHTCSYCGTPTRPGETFCCEKCAEMAFEEDAEAYLNGDLNDAKCEGTESSPVGSPRQRSFCKRMCGHRKKNTGSKTKSDPDSCVNQALRRWKCRCS